MGKLSKLAQIREEITKPNLNGLNYRIQNAPALHKKDFGTFSIFEKYAVIQMDILYIRESSDGYKFILNVIDIASRACDSEPCRDLKGERIVESLKQMAKRKYIDFKKVKVCVSDNGPEFKNQYVKEWFDEKNIEMRFTIPDRKTQNGVVEAYNHIISKAIYEKATEDELHAGTRILPSWTENLPKIVKVLNKEENLTSPNWKKYFDDPKITESQMKNRFHEGDLVHVKLNNPSDENGKLFGGFRNGDVRFEKEPTKITHVLILPNQPIRYMVEKYGNKASFLQKELLLHDPSNKLNTDIIKEKPQPQPQPITNKHHMITRTKSNIIKSNLKFQNPNL